MRAISALSSLLLASCAIDHKSEAELSNERGDEIIRGLNWVLDDEHQALADAQKNGVERAADAGR